MGKMFYPGEETRLRTLDLIPDNEEERLKAFEQYNILDTVEERAYDDLTLLATHICKAPIAVMTLIDRDRQWFKSKVGLDPSATQLPRGDAFCAYAILQPTEVMVVNDAKLDPRFINNPLVTGPPHIRFYAGAPLITLSGAALGTICVVDSKPRYSWGERGEEEKQKELLRALSRQVVAQMELRKALFMQESRANELAASHAQLEHYRLQLEQLNAELTILSTIDGLTNVNNRRAFDQQLHQACGRFQRYDSLVSLVMIDVDHFKSFNDQFGHPEGDKVLQRLGQIFRAIVRDCDVVARYGGEEFAIILPETNQDGAIITAERLRGAVETAEWPVRPITISIGIATAQSSCDHITLMQQADRALYLAKQTGRNRSIHIENKHI